MRRLLPTTACLLAGCTPTAQDRYDTAVDCVALVGDRAADSWVHKWRYPWGTFEEAKALRDRYDALALREGARLGRDRARVADDVSKRDPKSMNDAQARLKACRERRWS
jgi:hypothetical protein